MSILSELRKLKSIKEKAALIKARNSQNESAAHEKRINELWPAFVGHMNSIVDLGFKVTWVSRMGRHHQISCIASRNDLTIEAYLGVYKGTFDGSDECKNIPFTDIALIVSFETRDRSERMYFNVSRMDIVDTDFEKDFAERLLRNM